MRTPKRDQASKAKGLAWLLGALGLGILFAVGLSPLAHLVPMRWERHMGEALELRPPWKDCPSSTQADALLQKLVTRLYPLDPSEAADTLSVVLVKDPAVNAYALPGGKIVLNSGLLKQAGSPEELAGVLAHEMEHVLHRHVMEGILVHVVSWQGIRVITGGGGSTEFLQMILKMDFTRGQERQADEAGLKRLQKAQVDTQGMQRFFERMEREQPSALFLSDHPDNASRARMAAEHPTQAPKPLLSAAEWKLLREEGCGQEEKR